MRSALLVPVLVAALAPASQPRFAASVSRVSAADLRFSWRPGCPVAPAQLRRVRLRYVGFDGRAHTGALIVNETVVADVESVFARLYAARFPIRRLEPVDAFHGSDERSMAADNTSAFNCRYAVASGPKRWSVHAFGEAIDVNPVENPYLESGRVRPAAGARFLDRSRRRAGMAVAGGTLVRAFAAAGWQWGGRWAGSPDYQHFSATGG
jgi:D-alanyl-D-alanine carboxypeptidase